MMLILKILHRIVEHPLNQHDKWGAALRFFKWQLSSRLTSYPIIHAFTSNSKLIIGNGMTGATGNLYCGLHEFSDMAFVLHFLRAGDTFVDIGANIGSYTVLASAHVGASTICFEPVPKAFAALLDNLAINHISEQVTTYRTALGAAEGSIAFTSTLDTVNHVATEGNTQAITVPIMTLDGVLEGTNPILLKIDVEGFETEVLRGAQHVLENPSLQAIIIELNGAGARYGFDEAHIHQQLTLAGFTPYAYQPFERKLAKKDPASKTQNTIYIRDVAIVNSRIQLAENVKINGRTF
mgnify:CR=1 FL=1